MELTVKTLEVELGAMPGASAYVSLLDGANSPISEIIGTLTRVEQKVLASAILALESVDTNFLPKRNPKFDPAWVAGTAYGFGEFSSPRGAKFWSKQGGLTYFEMRRVYLRRIAIALWSEIHDHWPWSLLDIPFVHLTLLLSWAPDGLPNPLPLQVEKSAGSDYSKSANSTNGQQIFYHSDQKMLSPSLRIYHFSQLWDPDPFLAWKFAYFQVRPLLSSAVLPEHGAQLETYPSENWAIPSASLKPTSMARALPSLASALRAGRLNHCCQGFNSANTVKKLWPTGLLWPPQIAGNTDWFTASFSDVVGSGIGGCYTFAPIVVGVLRAMNIPGLVALSGVLPSKYNNPAVLDEMWLTHNQFVVNPHHTVLVPSEDLGLLHADDICGYHGNFFSSPGLCWVPSSLIALQRSVYGAESSDVGFKYSIDSPGLPESKLIAHFTRLRENLARDQILNIALGYGPKFANERLDSVVSSVPLGQKFSWVSRAMSAAKTSAGIDSIEFMQVCKEFFSLDYDLTESPPKPYHPLGACMGKDVDSMLDWGMSIMPRNWLAKAPSSKLEKQYGLASDPWVRNLVAIYLKTLASSGNSQLGTVKC